jgi:hypothetical protein
VGQHVRISKEKLKFAKGDDQNYTIEILKIPKAVQMTPPIGQFYAEERSPLRITKCTMYMIDKILKKRVRRGILEYLVRWNGYTADVSR